MRALPFIAIVLLAAPTAAQGPATPAATASAEEHPGHMATESTPPAPPAAEPSPVPSPPEERADGDAPASDVRYLDAAVNRTVWLPSAETNPEGTFFFGVYELVGLQFGYALTDDIELALTGVIPIDTLPYSFDLSLKWNVLRTSAFRIGLFGSIGVYVDGDREEAIGGRAGASFQVCFNDDCTSYATVSGGALITNHIDTSLPFAVGLGAVVRLHRLLAIAVEPLYGRIEQTNPEDVFVLNYVFRIGQLDWSLDVGMSRPFVDELSDGPFVAGFPWLAFNYRLGWEP